jgi:hypothetical protein
MMCTLLFSHSVCFILHKMLYILILLSVIYFRYTTHSICISSNSEGSKKFPDDGRLLSKHLGASVYNKGVVQISAYCWLFLLHNNPISTVPCKWTLSCIRTYPHYRNMLYYYPKCLRKLCRLCEVKTRKERIELQGVMSVRGRAHRIGRRGVKPELSVRESSVRNEIVRHIKQRRLQVIRK